MTTRAILLALALPLAAQQPRFDSNSRLVLIPATVTDSRYRPVDSLESADFLVSDNGLPRPVTVDTIGTGVAPIALIVAVQSSGISAAVLEKSRAIAAMIQPLVAGERGCAGVLSFDQRISLLQPCTNNPDAFARAFLSIQPLTRPGEDKQARLIDAVQSSVEHLVKLPNSRRVLLLISETRDRGSESSLDSAVIAAQTAGVTVYAATYSAFKTAFTSKAPVSQPRRAIKPKTPNDETGSVNAAPPGKNNPWPRIPPPERQIDALGGIAEIRRLGMTNTAEALAKATGGALFPFTRQKTLEEAIVKLGAELHSQYVLSFAPDSPAPGYHSLTVRLTRPGEFHIRARPGYWAAQ